MATLRAVRLGQALSQRDLARVAKVAQKTVVDIELGRVEPQLKTIRTLAAALGVEPQEVDEFREALAAKSGRRG
jgi:DNA-binding XRE family transcriptional regulator